MDDIETLRSGLASAKARLTAGADPDADLAAVGAALNAVIAFVHSHGMAEEAAPLLALSAAIDNVATGRKNPMFAPRKRVGRPSQPFEVEARLALASAAITLLIEDDQLSEKDAAAKVARVFEARKLPLPTLARAGAENWRALADWRNKLRQRKKDPGILIVYENAKRDARRECGAHGAAAILEILSSREGTA